MQDPKNRKSRFIGTGDDIRIIRPVSEENAKNEAKSEVLKNSRGEIKKADMASIAKSIGNEDYK